MILLHCRFYPIELKNGDEVRRFCLITGLFAALRIVQVDMIALSARYGRDLSVMSIFYGW
jgi:hypothetical protein